MKCSISVKQVISLINCCLHQGLDLRYESYEPEVYKEAFFHAPYPLEGEENVKSLGKYHTGHLCLAYRTTSDMMNLH